MTPNVQCLWYLATLRYVCVICHIWTPICNVLGYWRHRSVCYTSLFTTTLVVTTISVYSVLWPSDAVSRSGPFISCYLFGDLSSVSLSRCLFYLCLFCLSVISLSFSLTFLSSFSESYPLPLKYSDCAWNGRHLLSRCIFRCFGFETIWLFRKLLTVKNYWVAVE
jgi:hypothetical protein